MDRPKRSTRNQNPTYDFGKVISNRKSSEASSSSNVTVSRKRGISSKTALSTKKTSPSASISETSNKAANKSSRNNKGQFTSQPTSSNDNVYKMKLRQKMVRHHSPSNCEEDIPLVVPSEQLMKPILEDTSNDAIMTNGGDHLLIEHENMIGNMPTNPFETMETEESESLSNNALKEKNRLKNELVAKPATVTQERDGGVQKIEVAADCYPKKDLPSVPSVNAVPIVKTPKSTKQLSFTIKDKSTHCQSEDPSRIHTKAEPKRHPRVRVLPEVLRYYEILEFRERTKNVSNGNHDYVINNVT